MVILALFAVAIVLGRVLVLEAPVIGNIWGDEEPTFSVPTLPFPTILSRSRGHAPSCLLSHTLAAFLALTFADVFVLQPSKFGPDTSGQTSFHLRW